MDSRLAFGIELNSVQCVYNMVFTKLVPTSCILTDGFSDHSPAHWSRGPPVSNEYSGSNASAE